MRHRTAPTLGGTAPVENGAARERPRGGAAPDERRLLDREFSSAYDDLRRVAWCVLRSRSAAALNPSALVNEAWLKLARAPPVAHASPLHLRRLAARAMRQVLVEAARHEGARKRGGHAAPPLVPLEDSEALGASLHDPVVTAVEAALRRLAARSPRLASIVKIRFFDGRNVVETAALLRVSESTVLREWRSAKAWLARELRASDTDHG